MTYQWGQYERSTHCGTLDSLNQDPYRCATQHVAGLMEWGELTLDASFEEVKTLVT